MKKMISIVICMIFVTVSAGCNSGKENTSVDISKYTSASFEYIEDTGYKLITSEIGSLSTFNSLSIVPSETDHGEEWIYRITFNPKCIAPDGEEFVILFCSDCLFINGECYVAAEGVDYSNILSWAANKYTFFDYALIAE